MTQCSPLTTSTTSVATQEISSFREFFGIRYCFWSVIVSITDTPYADKVRYFFIQWIRNQRKKLSNPTVHLFDQVYISRHTAKIPYLQCACDSQVMHRNNFFHVPE